MLPTLKRVDYIADPDKLVLTPTLRRDLIKGWINKMVRQTKDTFSSQWAAPVLLTIVLGYSIYNTQVTNQINARMADDIRELNKSIVILQTQKEDQDKVIERERQEKFQLTRENEAWRESLKDDITELKLVLNGRIPKKKEN